MNMKILRATSRAVAISTALLWAGAVLANTPVDETRAVNPDARITVQNLSGSVELKGWDQDQVHVTGTLGENVEKLEIEGGGDSLRITVKYPKHSHNAKPTHLEVMLPRKARAEVEAVSADVRATGLEGSSLDLKSVSGDVFADAQTQDLNLHSVSGDVTFRGHAGRAELETVSGDIGATGLGDEVRVKTVSGDAELSGLENITRLEMQTVSGDLSVDIDSAKSPDIHVKSLSGEVKLMLPASVSAQITAKTFSGDINSDFGQVGEDGKRLTATAGGGDGRVEVESFSGEVVIRRR